MQVLAFDPTVCKLAQRFSIGIKHRAVFTIGKHFSGASREVLGGTVLIQKA